MKDSTGGLSFFGRVQIAVSCFFRALGDAEFAAQIHRAGESSVMPPANPTPELDGAAPQPMPVPATPVEVKPVAPKPAELSLERRQASGLSVLAMLQREGRLIDFLQEDLAGFPDADIGAAARSVHAGCRKVLAQCLVLEPVLKDGEGASITVPGGFDANRIRLTGNIAEHGPFRGALRHHGWVATEVRLPEVSEGLDLRVLAPAEVELS